MMRSLPFLLLAGFVLALMATGEADAETHYVVIEDSSYNPQNLTIKIGDRVTWNNSDDTLHTVTSDDNGSFDSGSINPGDNWSYTFNSTGTYDYHCGYHSSMTGTIEVVVSFKPIATIDSIHPRIVELNDSVSFSGHGNDTDGTIIEYRWGSSIEGNISFSTNFSTADLTFGNHTITFSVKDNDGVWSDNVTSWVDVRKIPEWNYTTGYEMYSIAISADGEYFVGSGDGNSTVYLFDKDNSTPLWSYAAGGSVRPWDIAISADGEYIAAGMTDRRVYLFDKDSNTPLWSYATGRWVYSVAISADGEYIAAGSQDQKVYLFGKDNSTPLWSYTTTGDYVNEVAISADGEYIVAGSWDGSMSDNTAKIYLFGKDNSTPLWSYETGDGVRSVSISADGEYITAVSGDKVYFFDRDGTFLWSYEASSIAISADGEYIATGTANAIYFFDKDSSTPLWSYTTGHNVRSVTISADGEYVAAGTHDNKIYLFDKDSSMPLWSYTAVDSVSPVAISADGVYLAAMSGTSSGEGSDDNVYAFRNDLVSRPSILPYGPRSGSETLFINTTLGWFPGSDDIANLTFDVYMSFVYNDVANNNSAALIADDITNYTHLVTDLNEGKKYYWKVVATDPSGSATSRIMNFTVRDVAAPVTDITSGPLDPTGYRNATFTFAANENEVMFDCKLDTGSWSDCTSPISYYGLSRGEHHLFQVKGTDPSGNEGEADDWMWEVLENEKPTASIDSISPQMAYLEHAVAFDGSGDDSDGSVVAYQWESSIGGIISNSANFSISDLELGNHTISFRVKDSDGDWSDDHVSWVYVTGPIAKIGSVNYGQVPIEFFWTETHQSYTNQTHPWNATYSDPGDDWCPAPAWVFRSDSNGEKLWGPGSCNGGEFGMYYGGGEGNLTTDSWDLSSYPSNTYLRIDHRYNWVVYNDSPSYDGGNVKVSTDNGENWSILKPVGGYPGTIYDYEDYGNPLYGQEAFVNFSGGQNHPEGVWVTDYFDLSIYTGLDNVKFKFHFGIYNYYWPGDYYHWHINDVSLVSGPLVPGFEFAGSGISSEYEIEEYEWYSSIDGFLSNQSHFSSFDLSDGKNHTIFFRIKDSYGFWSEYATTEIEVPDVTPPVVTIASGPDNIAVDTTATFRFTSNEHGSTFECALDGVEWVDCSSPKSYSNLTLSDHSFSVRAIDQSNNTSDTAYWNWTTRSQYVVYIEDNVYNSSYIEIVLGYAVTWVNNDDTLHTVTADDDLFDSGSLGPGDEWSYYFNDMGTYDYHCEYHDSMNGTVFVGDQPNESPIVWNITIDPNPAYEDERVYFDSDWEDSDGYVTVFEWTSDVDGLLSTNDSFDSDDLSIGNHTISFRVQDDDGEWSNWDTATLVIHPNTLPVADAGPDLKATPGSQATFFGSAVDTDGHIVLYEWDFDGDGVFDFSSSDNFSSHVYDEEGSYLVILRVTDNDGLTDTDTVEITISEEKVQIDDEGNVTVTDDKEDDEGNVTVTDAGEDEEGIPALSLITSIATIGIITLRRRS